MAEKYYVYILTTRKNTTLYIGVTGDLGGRIWEHKEGLVKGFSKTYSVNKLVYVEEFHDVKEALRREKCMKEWKREWNTGLIEKSNPGWNDLYEIL